MKLQIFIYLLFPIEYHEYTSYSVPKSMIWKSITCILKGVLMATPSGISSKNSHIENYTNFSRDYFGWIHLKVNVILTHFQMLAMCAYSCPTSVF